MRVYARDWLEGAGRFAALCLPYALDERSPQLQRALAALRDMATTGKGGAVSGLAAIKAGEAAGALHPALDPALSGLEAAQVPVEEPPAADAEAQRPAGQYRQPFEYGEILRALDMELNDDEVAARYFRERALPHLIRFPQRELPRSADVLPEGLETWDVGSPLEDVDWLESVMVSPRIVPGYTTVQRVSSADDDAQPRRQPLDLDLYVDSSGSMPNPQRQTSYLALAAAIVALSALQVGARVQATLWSGARQFISTGGFISDQRRVLRVITGHIGGPTAFPIHLLRETYAARPATARRVHILIISDDGVTTMFDADEHGNSGWEVARQALAVVSGGGTLALNLWQEEDPDLARAQAEGWRLSRVRTWEELVEFARSFSRLTYGQEQAAP